MKQSKVAVLVLNWNGYSDTVECVDSLENSTNSYYDICIIDNGSTDGSGQKLCDRFAQHDCLLLENNLGFAGGINRAIETIDLGMYDYVFVINNDTTVAEDTISKLVQIADNNPEYGIISPSVYVHSSPDEKTDTGGEIKPWHPKLTFTRSEWSETASLVEVDHLVGAAMFVRVNYIKTVGLMDETYFMYREETDWMIRGRSLGWKFAIAPQSKMWHKVSSSSGKGSSFVEYWMTRNTLKVYKMHYKKYYPLALATYFPYRALAALLKHRGHRINTIRGTLKGMIDHAKLDRR